VLANHLINKLQYKMFKILILFITITIVVDSFHILSSNMNRNRFTPSSSSLQMKDPSPEEVQALIKKFEKGEVSTDDFKSTIKGNTRTM